MKFRIGEIYEPTPDQGWEAAIDVRQDGEWHDRAICCYGVDRVDAMVLRNKVVGALKVAEWGRVTDE